MFIGALSFRLGRRHLAAARARRLAVAFLDVHDLRLEDKKIGLALAGEAQHVAVVILDPAVDRLAALQLDGDQLLFFTERFEVGGLFRGLLRRRRLTLGDWMERHVLILSEDGRRRRRIGRWAGGITALRAARRLEGQLRREGLAIGPGGSVGEELLFPDGYGFLERVDDPAAGVKGGGAMGAGDHDDDAAVADLQTADAV